MTLPGWAAGTWLIIFIAGFDHWLAFLLLVFTGIKMIIDGLEEGNNRGPVLALRLIPGIMISIATSIDARGVGISFAFLHADILVPAIIIDIRAFESSFAGVISGIRLKNASRE